MNVVRRHTHQFAATSLLPQKKDAAIVITGRHRIRPNQILSLSLSLIPASTPQQANNGIYYMCYDAYTLHATILLHGHGRAFLNNARYSKHWNLSHIGWAKMILNTNRS